MSTKMVEAALYGFTLDFPANRGIIFSQRLLTLINGSRFLRRETPKKRDSHAQANRPIAQSPNRPIAQFFLSVALLVELTAPIR